MQLMCTLTHCSFEQKFRMSRSGYEWAGPTLAIMGTERIMVPMSTRMPGSRGLHSSTFRLNLSAFCEIGGTFRGCPRGV